MDLDRAMRNKIAKMKNKYLGEPVKEAPLCVGGTDLY